MMDIAKAQPDESSRQWIMHIAKAKAEQDGDMMAWLPSQVKDFQDKLDRIPGNHRDLAELAIFRLMDLKDDLEHGDSGVAGILQTVKEESEIRKYIGHELREKAFGRYSIPHVMRLVNS